MTVQDFLQSEEAAIGGEIDMNELTRKQSYQNAQN